MIEPVVIAVLAGLLVGVLLVLCGVLWIQSNEREAWGRERAALIERLVPGVVLTEPKAPAVTERAYGSEVDEWAIEQERLRRGGYPDPYGDEIG